MLRPAWWLLHVFTVAVCVTMLLLGRWQWHVAHRHHGDIRYYAYAFQWWAFTGFALLMWYRIVTDYLKGPAATVTPPPGPESLEAESTPGPATGPRPVVGYRAYVPPTTAGPDLDPERVRFNAYLQALNAESEGRE